MSWTVGAKNLAWLVQTMIQHPPSCNILPHGNILPRDNILPRGNMLPRGNILPLAWYLIFPSHILSLLNQIAKIYNPPL